MYSIALGHVGEKGAAGAFGHTCGVRVDGAAPRGFLRFLGLTAFQAEGCGGGFAAIKRGRGWRRGLCRRVVKEKVLRIDRPDGRRVRKFDGAFGPEGCGIALTGDAYEDSVTGLVFCVIWHEKHSAKLSAFGRYTPYPAAPDFPRKRGQNKALKSSPFISSSQHNGAL